MNILKPSEVHTLLMSTIPAGMPVLLTGQPGIGKTDIVESARMACKAELILSHPVTSDPTDAKGLPAKISDTEAAFLPFGDLKRAMQAKKPTVWFLDDLGQATPSVQAAFMQLILARQVNGHKLPDCITFVAATNRRADKAGVSGMLEPVKSRFVTIIELRTDMQEWSSWAINSKRISPTLIAFLRLRTDLLSAFTATADMTNSPTPRTWSNLSRIESLKLPAAIEVAAMAGSVGEGAAVEYLAFRKMCGTMVSVDAILANPQSAALPNKPAECYAVCTGLAARANDKTIARIGTYATRLAQNDQGEFAALTIRDCIKRVPALANTADYVTLMCGPVGQLISGQTIS